MEPLNDPDPETAEPVAPTPGVVCPDCGREQAPAGTCSGCGANLEEINE